MTINIITATMIFDGPAGPWDSDYRDEMYYAVTLEVPPGTPGSKENDEYGRHEIRTTFYEGTKEEAFWKSLGRGDEVQMLVEESSKAKSGYSFKPIVPDDWQPQPSPQQATEQYESGGYDKTTYTPPKRSGSVGLDWLNPDHVEAVKLVGNTIADAIHDLVSEAQKRGWSEEVAQKIGVTAFIESKGYVKKYGADTIGAVAEVADEEVIIRGLDPDNLPDSFLVACAAASPHIENRNEATKILQRFGFDRSDLDPEDPESWVFLYAVARAYAFSVHGDGLSPDEAEAKVREAFDLGQDEPF